MKNTPYAYDYTGAAQTFTAPCNGYYKMEAWGASGSGVGGSGYVSGYILLSPNTTFYVYIGQQNGAFNGGGVSTPTNLSRNGSGASDIRTVSGAWNSINSLRSRIIVAGGSGNYGYGGQNTARAGGLNGYDALEDAASSKLHLGKGGTQTTGGSGGTYVCSNTSGAGSAGTFGIGGAGGGPNRSESYYNGSGGGGWYGGGGSGAICNGTNGGAGGSSYISGHAGSIAVTSSSNTSPKCSAGSTSIACSQSWTGYSFTNTLMIDGAGYKWTNTKQGLQQMPNPNGGYYASGVGHSGNGAAKITYLGTSI